MTGLTQATLVRGIIPIIQSKSNNNTLLTITTSTKSSEFLTSEKRQHLHLTINFCCRSKNIVEQPYLLHLTALHTIPPPPFTSTPTPFTNFHNSCPSPFPPSFLPPPTSHFPQFHDSDSLLIWLLCYMDEVFLQVRRRSVFRGSPRKFHMRTHAKKGIRIPHNSTPDRCDYCTTHSYQLKTPPSNIKEVYWTRLTVLENEVIWVVYWHFGCCCQEAT